MDDTFYLSVFGILPERVEVDTAKQFGNSAVGVLFAVFAFNYIGTAKSYFLPFLQPLELLVGLFAKVVLLNENSPSKGNLTRARIFILRVVDRFDFEDFIFRPVRQLDFEWIHDRHATTAGEIKLLAYGVFQQRDVARRWCLGYSNGLAEATNRGSRIATATHPR